MANNQKELVLEWLQKFGTINVGEASAELGVHCLHKRISDLREDGWVIDSSEQKDFVNRMGNHGEMAIHRLVVSTPITGPVVDDALVNNVPHTPPFTLEPT